VSMVSLLLSHKTYIGLVLGGFLATYLLVPVVRILALRLNAFDPPSERRVQQRHIPSLGGLAVAACIYVGIGLLYLWPNVISAEFFARPYNVGALLLGGLPVLALGVYDDLHGADATVKFGVQILAGLIVCTISGPIRSIRLPLAGNVELGLAAVPVTIFWIVAVTNAFNLIDGVDGLAAGVGALVCAASFFIAHMYGHVDMMVFAAIMTGSLVGFLLFNFHPASIFLGDTGSLFLGFTIAVASMHSAMKTPTTVLMLIPLCMLGYPLLDTSLAIVRRFLKGKPIFSCDRSHIHHKLLAAGLGHRAASGVAYGLTLLFTGVAVLHLCGRNGETGILLAVAVVVLAAMFKVFGYWEFVRTRFSPALRRKYRVYNLFGQVVSLKMQDARNVDELWQLICQLGKEFDLHSIRLCQGSTVQRSWQNPAAEGHSEHGARAFDLPGGGTLWIGHNGQKHEDIELEQNILLERISNRLTAHMRRLARCAAAADGSGPKTG